RQLVHRAGADAVDAHDVGAEVGQDHSAERCRREAGHFDDANSGERTHGGVAMQGGSQTQATDKRSAPDHRHGASGWSTVIQMRSMKPTLQPGLTFTFRYTVPPTRTVPHLYPESELFRAMPEVFATGYLVGLVEWACI